jgi:hypothetical protein
MDVQSVSDTPEPVNCAPTFISRREHRRRLGGMSKATELRLIKNDPDHPKPFPVGPGFFVYSEQESDSYRRLVLERSKRNGAA